MLKRLVIINSPHPATLLRELQHSPAQQAASAYMNFLCRPDAEALLRRERLSRRMWPFFTTWARPTPATARRRLAHRRRCATSTARSGAPA